MIWVLPTTNESGANEVGAAASAFMPRTIEQKQAGWEATMPWIMRTLVLFVVTRIVTSWFDRRERRADQAKPARKRRKKEVLAGTG